MPPPRRALTLLPVLLVASSTGCTSHDGAPTPRVSPARSASTLSAPPMTEAPPALSVPPETPDEISRVVYVAEPREMSSVLHREAHPDQQYALDAACASATPGRVLTYQLRSATVTSNTVVASGELPCDGNVIRNSAVLPATEIQITFGPDLAGVTMAYAVLAPLT